jgi:hypothetical protein
MIMIALQSLQMEAGILAHLLTDPTPLLIFTGTMLDIGNQRFYGKKPAYLGIHQQLEF